MKKYIEDTLDYYNSNAKQYQESWSEDFLNNYNFDIPDIFLSYLKPDAYILDLGCGTGRDSKYFMEKGYRVKSIDGSHQMCKMASELLNIEVEEKNFLDIDYVELFDGIYACASLLHLSNEDLIICLKKINTALKTNGIIYASFKMGEEERIKEKRYYNDMNESKFKCICGQIEEFKILKTWVTKQYQTDAKFINFIIKKS